MVTWILWHLRPLALACLLYSNVVSLDWMEYATHNRPVFRPLPGRAPPWRCYSHRPPSRSLEPTTPRYIRRAHLHAYYLPVSPDLFNGDTRKPSVGLDGWDKPTKRERKIHRQAKIATLNQAFLHIPEFQYGEAFGDFCNNLDPIGHLQALQDVCSVDFITSESTSMAVTDARIMAHANYTVTEDMAHLDNDKAYLSPLKDADDDTPIVIDTGASLSLSPFLTDFVGPLESCPLDKLHGLNGTSAVNGIGTVQ